MVFNEESYSNQHEAFSGIDVDWYAIDSVGHIGYFTSAGISAIPSSIVVISKKLPWLHERFIALPTTFSPEVVIDAALRHRTPHPDMLDGFVAYRKEIENMGKRGIYCYDAHPDGDLGYLRLVTPTRPLHLDALPENVRTCVYSVAPSDCTFSETQHLL